MLVRALLPGTGPPGVGPAIPEGHGKGTSVAGIVVCILVTSLNMCCVSSVAWLSCSGGEIHLPMNVVPWPSHG